MLFLTSSNIYFTSSLLSLSTIITVFVVWLHLHARHLSQRRFNDYIWRRCKLIPASLAKAVLHMIMQSRPTFSPFEVAEGYCLTEREKWGDPQDTQ